METALIFSQTVFYFTVSLVIIMTGVFWMIVAYHLVRIVRELERLSKNLHLASSEVSERIKDILDNLSALPLLSYLFRKSYSRRHNKKSESK